MWLYQTTRCLQVVSLVVWHYHFINTGVYIFNKIAVCDTHITFFWIHFIQWSKVQVTDPGGWQTGISRYLWHQATGNETTHSIQCAGGYIIIASPHRDIPHPKPHSCLYVLVLSAISVSILLRTTFSQAAEAYDIRAMQFGRTEHLNYNTRGGDSFHQQDLSRVMNKRILGATLIGLSTKRQRLVHILILLSQKYEDVVNNHQQDGYNCRTFIKNEKGGREKSNGECLLLKEAENLLQEVDASHNRVRECLEVLLFEY